MKLTDYSKKRIYDTFEKWRVARDFAEPMYNYLVFGFEPGSCFTSVLANDFFGAMTRSHPSNTVQAFKDLVKWIADTVPAEARGSYAAVKYWTALPEDTRRSILEDHRLVYKSEEEVWMTLQGRPSVDPELYYEQ
jgi:Txe/YoeB family toxin of Txe-Axe toxin-antitoxin module